ncbi:hypothetical protein BGX27_008865 [Mortierella sp. AM989]|nr:hypothetical protein BGX27_008865 [Mortierella sp. AM989]
MQLKSQSHTFLSTQLTYLFACKSSCTMQVFFRNFDGKLKLRQLPDDFTLDDFLETATDAMSSQSRDETLSWRYVVSGKPLDVKNLVEFDRMKHLITKECNIYVLGRLLGGYTLPDTLQIIAEQQLEEELDKVAANPGDCMICFDSETDCIRVCCTSMCREDLKSWLLDRRFKISCTVCTQPVALRDIFKTPEYVATLQALVEEKQLLQNIDCQRCLDCYALMHNETMDAHQTCISCHRQFCFFCNRKWNATTMRNRKNTCGRECVYETMLSFQLIDFHYDKVLKIPSQRTCPKCFNFGGYDNKCKYHTCTECKFTFCFLCLEDQVVCQEKYKSKYYHACVPTPIPQDYSMFPRLLS